MNKEKRSAPCKRARALNGSAPRDPFSIKHFQPSTVTMPFPDFWQNLSDLRHVPGLGYPDTLKGPGKHGEKSEKPYWYDIVMSVGWGGRIRTYGTRYQKALPYHLATPQC